MEAFGRFWDANALMIGIGCTVLALIVAVALKHGTAASVIGLIGGMAFMWMGRPAAPVDTGDDD